jgi:hypothetical protein
MVFYEGVFSVVAGAALVACAVLVVRRSYLRGAAVAFAGSAPLSLFFWFAAIPTGLSDIQFAYASTPIPLVALIAALALAARRTIHRPEQDSAPPVPGG